MTREQMEWRYSPVWDAKSAAIGRFRLIRRLAEAPATSESRDGEDAFATELAGVAKAKEDLASLIREERRRTVVCTVRAASLTKEDRGDQIRKSIGQASSAVRRLFALEIVADGFASTTETRKLIDFAVSAYVQCTVCAPLSAQNEGPSPDDEADGAAADMTGCEDEEEAIARLGVFARRCARAGVISVAHGLHTRALVLGAIAAGVRQLSGRAIHADVAAPQAGLRFVPGDLYSQYTPTR